MTNIILPLSLTFAVAACGDHEGFEDLPTCVEDHIDLGEARSIAHCLIDFPDLHPELPTQQACVDWVADNGGYPDSRDEACTIYFEEQ